MRYGQHVQVDLNSYTIQKKPQRSRNLKTISTSSHHPPVTASNSSSSSTHTTPGTSSSSSISSISNNFQAQSQPSTVMFQHVVTSSPSPPPMPLSNGQQQQQQQQQSGANPNSLNPPAFASPLPLRCRVRDLFASGVAGIGYDAAATYADDGERWEAPRHFRFTFTFITLFFSIYFVHWGFLKYFSCFYKRKITFPVSLSELKLYSLPLSGRFFHLYFSGWFFLLFFLLWKSKFYFMSDIFLTQRIQQFLTLSFSFSSHLLSTLQCLPCLP